MHFAEVVSIIALLVSLASLSATLYFNLRDRARVVAKSEFYEGYSGDVPSMSVSIVNAGRRPIVLRMWAGTDGKENWAGTMLNSKEGGQRLAEHERYDLHLTREDLVAFTPDDNFVFSDLWVEDTLGRRYAVAQAKDNIRKLWGRNGAT